MQAKSLTAIAFLGLFALAPVGSADAKPRKSKSAKEATVAGPTPITKRLSTAHNVKWGMKPKEVAKAYDRYFEKKFLPKYKSAGPGPERGMLDAELAAKKAELRRVIKFGLTPTGIDNTPLKGEYTYNNGEALASVSVGKSTKRHFFFIKEKLWKVYGVRKLGPKSKLGKTFNEVVKNMSKKMGAEPFMTPPDFASGRLFATAEWTDGRTVLRLVNREEQGLVGVVKIHQDTLLRLAELRTNKVKDAGEVDKEIEMVTRKPDKGPLDPNSAAADAYVKGKRKKN
jgi:hypothetical protein